MGSGPGGLGCAYHLRRQGYASVIFEALDKPGGMLRAGIPAWHLPEEILDAEIAKLLDLGGIEIRCGVRVGAATSTLDELARRHDAVFLALGQDVGRRLDAEGAQARGVIGALEFLRETGLGRPVQIGKERPGHRRRQHGLRRGPVRDQARRRTTAECHASCPWKPRPNC